MLLPLGVGAGGNEGSVEERSKSSKPPSSSSLLLSNQRCGCMDWDDMGWDETNALYICYAMLCYAMASPIGGS
jgi:hypothetical protein